jgi:outer membrane protein assembly factor BamB
MRRSISIFDQGAIIAASVFVLVNPLRGIDWPQWRGPERNGISQEKSLLKEWPKSGPKLIWQIKDAGAGYSTPAIVGDRIYALGNEGDDDEFVESFEVANGKRAWRTHIGKVGNPKQQPPYPGTRSTPTVDGDTLFALGSDGDLASIDVKKGTVRWQKNLRKEFGGIPGTWAYSESPLVDGNALICTPGGSNATMVALNKRSGEVIWKAAIPGGDQAAYASIIIVNAGGKKEYVQFVQKGIVGVDASNGKFLWRYDKTAQGSPANIPSPVAADGFIYSATGRGGGGLIKLKSDSEVEQVYFSPKLPNSIGGAVKVGDFLYGTTGQGILCVEFTTGKIKWEERGIGAGSICYAEGNLYVHGENGDVALVEATPEVYREKGRFTPPEAPDRGKSKAWAYPVVANGRLYIRDLNSMWSYDVKEGR